MVKGKYFLLIISVFGLSNCLDSEKQEPVPFRKIYQCKFTDMPPIIDGNLSEETWSQASWSEYFVDIEGEKRPKPYYNTKIKMLWDAENLYIAAQMEEKHIWGYVLEKNVPVFKYGNDFEVFIDPDRDHHNYYELELNVLNTIWELTLEKPYRNGGPAIDPTNLEGLRTAVAYDGTPNNPSDIDSSWSVEIAIPFEDLYNYRKEFTRVLPHPKPMIGEKWGINFSRVHWDHEILEDQYKQVPNQPEYNWVWSPQGEINMHAPEHWGIVVFGKDEPKSIDFQEERVRQYVMLVYKAQKSLYKWSKRYSNHIEDLELSNLSPDC